MSDMFLRIKQPVVVTNIYYSLTLSLISIFAPWLSNSSTTLSVGYAAHTSSAGAAVSLSAAAYKAAGSSASATAANVANTIALGENSIVDANKDGLPVSVTLGGASADGTIQLTMMYVVD